MTNEQKQRINEKVGEYLVKLKQISHEQLRQIREMQQLSNETIGEILTKLKMLGKDTMRLVQDLQLRLVEGDLLMQHGLATQGQVDQAMLEPFYAKEGLATTLVQRMKALEQADAEKLVHHYANAPMDNITEPVAGTTGFTMIIPKAMAEELSLIPLVRIGQQLIVAMMRPDNLIALDNLKMATNCNIIPKQVNATVLSQMQKVYYPAEASPEAVAEEQVAQLDTDALLEGIETAPGGEEEKEAVQDILAASAEAPIVKLVNGIIARAVKARASDIHIEGKEDKTVIRFRKDGVLGNSENGNLMELPKQIHNAMVSRFKIMSALDISERRLPQDGHIQVKMSGRQINLRVSTMPTKFGETVVMRVVDRGTKVVTLDHLGFTPELRTRFEDILDQPYGIVYVTGPTGSGKSTTLYAAVDYLNGDKYKIITIEDPIELTLGKAVQVQVQPKIELTFARVLRAILRQDPDIVLIGETRDKETAQIACEAAMTGHQVLTTLHTNDAVGAINRLSEMGVEPFLIGASTIGIVAQRLVRIVCPHCAEPYEPTNSELAKLGIYPEPGQKFNFSKGAGCTNCNQSGYFGRMGVYEVLKLTEVMRSAIVARAPEEELRRMARASGQGGLGDHAIQLVKEGLTTVDEAAGVIFSEASPTTCPHCNVQVRPTDLVCPWCHQKIKDGFQVATPGEPVEPAPAVAVAAPPPAVPQPVYIPPPQPVIPAAVAAAPRVPVAAAPAAAAGAGPKGGSALLSQLKGLKK